MRLITSFPHNESSRKPAAFTLIELLIVVAIIAILAAIAVPNFLEAQVRSKVSRAKSDMRSIATAIEAYAVDHNGYFLNDQYLHTNLTTPVAYMTTMPNDPFGWDRYRGINEYDDVSYEYGIGKAGERNVTNRELGNTWMIESSGPDKHDGTGSNTDGSANNYLTSQFPWPTATNVAEMIGLVYDSTNGTKSFGEIFRAGGVVTGPNEAHAVWFATVSK